jgi:hypothetical protein
MPSPNATLEASGEEKDTVKSGSKELIKVDRRKALSVLLFNFSNLLSPPCLPTV